MDEHPVTVLVVDDQPRFLAVARTVIERTAGFTLVGQAVDGAEALDKVVELRPQMVLMDIHMPKVDGLEATRRIGAMSPDTVVVLLSSYAQADLPAEFRLSGAAGYLHKEELAPSAVQQLWHQHGPPQRT